MLCYDIINEIATFMKVTDNDKIMALCDACDVPYEWVEEIEINEEVLRTVTIDIRDICDDDYHVRARRSTKIVERDGSISINPHLFLKGVANQYISIYFKNQKLQRNTMYYCLLYHLPRKGWKERLLHDFIEFWIDNPIEI